MGFKFFIHNINSLDCPSRSCFHLLEKSLSPGCVIVLYSFMRWSIRCSHKKGHRAGAREQSFLYPQVLEGLSHEWASWGEQKGSSEREDPWSSEGQGGVLSRRCQRSPLMRLNVTRSESWEGRKGDLWQGPASSYWCTWSPGRGAHGLFWEVVSSRKIGSFKIYNIFSRLCDGVGCLSFPEIHMLKSWCPMWCR